MNQQGVVEFLKKEYRGSLFSSTIKWLALCLLIFNIWKFSGLFRAQLPYSSIDVLIIIGMVVLDRLFRDKIYRLIRRPKPVDPVQVSKIQEAFDRVMEKYSSSTGSTFKPRLRIRPGKKPHACCYGFRLLGYSTIEVNSSLIPLLQPNEMEAVLAHELGHAHYKDFDRHLPFIFGLLIIMILSLFSFGMNGFAFYETGISLCGIGLLRFMEEQLLYIVSFMMLMLLDQLPQHKEYRADFFATTVLGDARPLITALGKIGLRVKAADRSGQDSPRIAKLREFFLDASNLALSGKKNEVSVIITQQV